MRIKMVEVVPEGQRGCARIVHVKVDKLSAIMSTMRGSPLSPGRICQLLVRNQLAMSDGENEFRTNQLVGWKARGDVLIAGLGIGMIVLPIMAKPEVRTITIVEKEPDVRALVEGPIRRALGDRAAALRVETADIFDWKPTGQFDTIYFDIWNEMSTDDLPTITKLKRQYRKALRPGGWMGAWNENELKARRRRERTEAKRHEALNQWLSNHDE